MTILGPLLLLFTLSLDLAQIKAEPKFDKRSQLALQYANTTLDSAKADYQNGRFEETQAALTEVTSAVTLSYDALASSGKNPRKTGAYKDAEKSTREILRRLTGFRESMASVDQPIIDPVIQNVRGVHELLLENVMGKK